VNLSTGELSSGSRSQINSNHFAQGAWICKNEPVTRSPTTTPTTSSPIAKPTTELHQCVGAAETKYTDKKKNLKIEKKVNAKACRKKPKKDRNICLKSIKQTYKQKHITILKQMRRIIQRCKRNLS